jgi:hypothetical protein
MSTLSELEYECKAMAADLRGELPADPAAARRRAMDAWKAGVTRQADEFRAAVATKTYTPRRYAEGLEIKIV